MNFFACELGIEKGQYKTTARDKIVWFQKITIGTPGQPWRVIGNFKGDESIKTRISREMGGEKLDQNTLSGKGMDIFKNNKS